MSVLDEITAERRRQDEEWGGPAHDDAHTLNHDWVQILDKHFERLLVVMADAEFDEDFGVDVKEIRREAIIVAALAVALIESLDRSRVDSTTADASAQGETPCASTFTEEKTSA